MFLGILEDDCLNQRKTTCTRTSASNSALVASMGMPSARRLFSAANTFKRGQSLPVCWSRLRLSLRTSRSSCSSSKKPGATPTKQRQYIYHWLDDVENLEKYVPGGYHPTHIGDELSQGRYVIVHKLGFGGFSTGTESLCLVERDSRVADIPLVWLARDHRKGRYVSLKIIEARASAASSEASILQRLRLGDPEHPGRSAIQTLLDQFSIDGPNGRHCCLVSEVAGCSVANSKEAGTKWKFSPTTARAIAARTAMGLAYIHSCGITHGGKWENPHSILAARLTSWPGPDLHLNNILLPGPELDAWTVDEVYKNLGEPKREPNRRVDDGPLGPEVSSYSVFPVDMTIPAERIEKSRIRISDFGEAFSGEPPKTLRTPIFLLPPEVIFHEEPGPAADIWTLACIIYEILGETSLFQTLFASKDDILAEMISTLGPLPSRWWPLWQNRPKYFTEDGSWIPELQGRLPQITRPLKERLWNMGRGRTPEQCEFSVEEMASLGKLLAAMLVYEPSERITIDEVVESDYMTRWGRPALEKA